MTMNGQPGVVGAGNDANNYLDIRNEEQYTDQGTVRIDRNFHDGSTCVFSRYSAQRRARIHAGEPARLRLLPRQPFAAGRIGLEPGAVSDRS